MLYNSSLQTKAQVSGKRVLITGASSGIGEQVAYQYAALGANVFITARREQNLRKVFQIKYQNVFKMTRNEHNVTNHIPLNI